MINSILKFTHQKDIKINEIEKILETQFKFNKETNNTGNIIFYDTFDWSLYQNSLVLSKIDNTLSINKLYSSASIACFESNTDIKFAEQISDKYFRAEIESIIKMRALLKICEIETVHTTFNILDKNEKTIVRLACNQIITEDNKQSLICEVIPIRGYDKAHKEFIDFIQENGFIRNDKVDLFLKALKIHDIKANNYTSKIKLELKAENRATTELLKIFRYLTNILKINEPYIEKDIDTEFLHDFRVSVRRIRSAIGQFKNIFPDDLISKLKNEMRFVGKLTNDLRDLDVYLLAENKYKNLLPDKLKPHIAPLFKHLKRKRTYALKKVVKEFETKEYKDAISTLKKFPDDVINNIDQSEKYCISVLELAKNKILKKYKQINKKGQKLLHEINEESFHELRIECKKLRYLLEFFTSLFPEIKIKFLIKQLKALQDNLGEFNDYVVQQEYLFNIADDMSKRKNKDIKLYLAVGSLLDNLDSKKQNAINKFSEVFIKFTNENVKLLFTELFDN